MKIILDLDTKEIYSEVKVRCLLLEEECGDILNNKVDYVRDEMNIDAQLNCIRFAIKEQNIEKIIETLNESWNYNIKIFEDTRVVEDFKNGFATIVDIIDSLNIDLLDKDIEDLEKYIKEYKRKENEDND